MTGFKAFDDNDAVKFEEMTEGRADAAAGARKDAAEGAESAVAACGNDDAETDGHEAPEFDMRIENYEPMIQSIIGRLNIRFDRDDYMQVGRLAVYNALSTYDDIAARGATESQFVYTRIYQRMIDEIRRVSRYTNAVSATEDDLLIESVGGCGADAVLLGELRDMLGTLDERERQWLLLTLDGYTVVEIAAASGFSVSSVKNWRKGARAKLDALRG